jgi:hypothetical protein
MRNLNLSLAVHTGVALLALLGAASTSPAGVVFDSGGFESGNGYPPNTYLYNEPTPAGSPGPGIGQWTGTSYSDPYAAVYTYQAIFGSNSNLSNTQLATIVDSSLASGGSAIYYPLLNTFTPVSGSGDATVSAQFQLAVSTGATGHPFFGVVMYSGSTPVAQAGVDATTGGLIGSSVASTFTATPDTFYDFDLVADYTAGSYAIYESPAVASPTYTEIGSSSFLASATTFTTAALGTYVASGAGPAAGDGYFDNFSISTTSVPEPTSGWFLLMPFGTLLLRRRRAQPANG